jgi:speckle-type POZ protein
MKMKTTCTVETTVEVVNRKIDWKVENFFAITWMNVGDRITSPAFNVGDQVLSLHLFSNGFSEEHKDYLGLYVSLKGPCEQLNGIVKFKMTGQALKFSVTYEMNHGIPFSNDHLVGSPRFASRNVDFNMSHEIVDHIVTISCEIALLRGVHDKRSSEITFDTCMSMATDFDGMWNENDLTDVIIRCKNKEFKCHKVILAARSPVFKAMFTRDTLEAKSSLVTIEDVNPDVLNEFLKFVYSGSVKNMESFATELIVNADKYIVPSLINMCAAHLEENINEENGCRVLLLGAMLGIGVLRDFAIEFIVRNGVDKFITTENFKKVVLYSPETFALLIQRVKLLDN